MIDIELKKFALEIAAKAQSNNSTLTVIEEAKKIYEFLKEETIK